MVDIKFINQNMIYYQHYTHSVMPDLQNQCHKYKHFFICFCVKYFRGTNLLYNL